MRKLKNSELNRKNTEEFKKADKLPFVVILDNIRSMHNIGSVFRTCDALLIDKMYLCGITAIPPHKDIHKTALGAQDTMEWTYIDNSVDLVKTLKDQGYIIVSIEQTEGSTSLSDFCINSDQKYALIFGNEIKGVDQKVIDQSDFCIEIPQYGTKHSFNISVSVGIVLWELTNKGRK
ncbi:RNA methyltransferase [Bacteroidota bacterium]